MSKEKSTQKMFRMCNMVKLKNEEAFLAENEKNLFASELSNISSEIGAIGTVKMFHHIISIVKKLDYGKDWCYLGRILYWAGKKQNEEIINQVVDYVHKNNLKEKLLFHSCKGAYWLPTERDDEITRTIIDYFDCTDLIELDYLPEDFKNQLIKEKLYNDLHKNLAPKGKSKSSKI